MRAWRGSKWGSRVGVVARRRTSFTSTLYQAARLSSDLDALTSGNPRRVAKRAKNVALGRSLARAGVWRALWK